MFEKVADIGGGIGSLLIGILKANPPEAAAKANGMSGRGALPNGVPTNAERQHAAAKTVPDVD